MPLTLCDPVNLFAVICTAFFALGLANPPESSGELRRPMGRGFAILSSFVLLILIPLLANRLWTNVDADIHSAALCCTQQRTSCTPEAATCQDQSSHFVESCPDWLGYSSFRQPRQSPQGDCCTEHTSFQIAAWCQGHRTSSWRTTSPRYHRQYVAQGQGKSLVRLVFTMEPQRCTLLYYMWLGIWQALCAHGECSSVAVHTVYLGCPRQTTTRSASKTSTEAEAFVWAGPWSKQRCGQAWQAWQGRLSQGQGGHRQRPRRDTDFAHTSATSQATGCRAHHDVAFGRNPVPSRLPWRPPPPWLWHWRGPLQVLPAPSVAARHFAQPPCPPS